MTAYIKQISLFDTALVIPSFNKKKSRAKQRHGLKVVISLLVTDKLTTDRVLYFHLTLALLLLVLIAYALLEFTIDFIFLVLGICVTE